MLLDFEQNLVYMRINLKSINPTSLMFEFIDLKVLIAADGEI